MEAEAAGAPPSGVAAEVLAGQARLIRWDIADRRAAVAVKAMTALAGAAVVAFAGALAWQAADTDGIVLEPFATPPAMAQKGLTGAVVAGQVLDRLRAMQAETSTARAVATYGGGWGEGIRLSIPNTGVSLGEVQAYLVGWLGDQTRVSGDVFERPDGQLAITTRVGSTPGSTVAGPPADLDVLIGKSAEAIYAGSQPYLYSRWLAQHDREAEALAILQRLVYSPDKTERLWSLFSMGGAGAAGSYAEGKRFVEAALRVDPDFMPAVLALAGLEGRLGNLEQALQLRERLVAGADKYRKQAKPGLADEQLAINQAFIGMFTGDFSRGIKATQSLAGLGGADGNRRQTMMRGAQHALALHDLPLARRLRDEGGLTDARLAELEATISTGGSLAARERLALEDWSAAADGLAPVWSDPRAFPYERATYLVALARAGRVAEAEALLAARPTKGMPAGETELYNFLIARGVIADAAGRRGEADRLFARAVTLGQSLPQVHDAWSRALLTRGDAAGALKQAKLAVKKGPRWPDAHLAEGRALHALRRPVEAAKAYARAAKLTPNWGALEIDWGMALAAQGKGADAHAKWRRALALDLSPADRARVTALLAGRPA